MCHAISARWPADNCPAISAADAVPSVARLVEKLLEQVAQFLNEVEWNK
jgi:hypothetical protein